MEWSFQYTPLIWPILMTAVFCLAFFVYGLHHSDLPGAIFFNIFCFIGGLWALCFAFQLLSVDFAVKLFCWRIEFFLKLIVNTTILCFILAYAGLGKWLSRRNLTLLSIPLLAFGFLFLTNDLHHFIYSEIYLDYYIRSVDSAGNMLSVAYNYLLYFAMVGVLLWLYVRSPLHRWPVALILVGSLILRTVFLLDYLGWWPNWPFEPVILFFNIPLLAYAMAIFHFNFFNVVPLAREMIVDQIKDGFIIIDAIGRIADLNPVAQAMLGMPRGEAIGQEARQVLGERFALQQLLDDPSIAQAEIQTDDGSRWLESNLTSLVDTNSRQIGQIMLIHDITELHQIQVEQLEREHVNTLMQERHRMARDLHDDISQELNFINLQSQAAHELLAGGQFEQANVLLLRLSEVARKVQFDLRELIFGLRTAPFPEKGLSDKLSLALKQTSFTDGTQAEMRHYSDGSVQKLEPHVEDQLLYIVQEALINIRKHARAEKVLVTLEINETGIEVIVEDDGVGFDPGKLAEDRETFGLRIMAERAEGIGGAFSVASKPGDGTQVIVRVPVDSPTAG